LVATSRPSPGSKRRAWVPDRQDIIWIDCNPQIGKEMRDLHPFLVLSPRIFNEKTSLVIGLPMTTAEYNADNPLAVVAGQVNKTKTGQTRSGKTSYVLCHQPKSFDWRLRNAKPHSGGRLSDSLFAQVCECLNQIIRVA
jgi:mRNA interferase MazF